MTRTTRSPRGVPRLIGARRSTPSSRGWRQPKPARMSRAICSASWPTSATAGRPWRPWSIPPVGPGPIEGPRFITMQTVVPLRGIAAAGFATDPRAERAYEWLLAIRLQDGSWPAGPKADLGQAGSPMPPEKEYRRLTRGLGCRSATTGAVACLAMHPERRRSDVARIGVDHLLARETRDASTLGWEVSRLVGLERAMGQVTFYATFDLAFLLDLASRCGVSPQDRRVHDLVNHLDTLRGPYGLWQHSTHPQLAGWLSLDLESSLRRLEDGDWIGNEEPAALTTNRRGPRRY